MWGSTHSRMFLGGFLAFRQVSMKVWWWLALNFLYLSSKFVVVVSSSSSSFSISLIPSRVLLRIPLRFTFPIESNMSIGLSLRCMVSFKGF